MKILVATDGSEYSAEAVDKCAELLKFDEPSEIRVVSIIEPLAPVGVEPFGVSTNYYAEAEKEAEEASAQAREFNAARRYSGQRVSRSTSQRSRSQPDNLGEALAQAVVRELGGTTGRRIVRGILGSLFKGR